MATKSILSAAVLMASVLSESQEVTSITSRIIPVGSLDIDAPYVVFRRKNLREEAVKNRQGPDSGIVEVLCVSNDYDESLELAEAVRAALHGRYISGESDEPFIRSCRLADAKEYKDGDAFVQHLEFIIKL